MKNLRLVVSCLCLLTGCSNSETDSGAIDAGLVDTGATDAMRIDSKILDASLDAALDAASQSDAQEDAGSPPPMGCSVPLPRDHHLWVDNSIGSDNNTGTEFEPFETIRAAVDRAVPSTEIHVVDTGVGYEGVCVENKENLTIVGEGLPIVDKLVVCDGRNALFFSRSDDIRFVRFRLLTESFAGQHARALLFSGLPSAPIYRNSGCRIHAFGPGQGESGRSLISSSLCYDCVLEHSVSVGAEEHGIYWTNHQDGSLVRFNYVEDADGACIQFNADPETYTPGDSIRDGVMSDGLIEGNVMKDCGTTGGGAALNLAGVKNTVIRNNLIYGTSMTGGIASWDDGYSDWGSPGDFSFGCSNNVFFHNTIDCRSCDRHAFSFRNGSTDNRFINNIVITDGRDAIAVDTESNTGLEIDNNLYLAGTEFEDTSGNWIDLSAWQALGFDRASLTTPDLDAIFVDVSGGDYHLKENSPARGAARDVGVTHDLGGKQRPAQNSDIGAYQY